MLKITCLHCHRFKMPQFSKTLFLIQMKLLDAGLINAAQQAGEIAERKEDRDEKKKGVDQAEDLAMDNKLKEFASLHLSEEEDKDMERMRMRTNYTTRSIEQLRKEYCKRLLTQGKETTCPQCGANTKKIALYKSRFIYEGIRMTDTGDEEVEMSLMGIKKKSRGMEREKSEMTPAELRDHFRSLYSTDHDLLRHLFPVMKRTDLKHPTDVLFLEAVPVPPPRARPCQFTGGIMTQHPQSQVGLNILQRKGEKENCARTEKVHTFLMVSSFLFVGDSGQSYCEIKVIDKFSILISIFPQNIYPWI